MLTHILRQELYRLGILYNDSDDLVQDSESNTIACDVSVESPIPTFIIRQGKPRRSRRRLNWHSPPLYLSLSSLSDNADIARFSTRSPLIPTIQHPTNTPSQAKNPRQSLPPSAFETSHHLDITVSISSRPHILDLNSIEDWTFITTAHHAKQSPTPSSEPETWILIDDS